MAQDHTFYGRRGKHVVYGVTFEQLHDAVVDGIAAARHPGGTLDLHAAAQNVCCEVEKLMGIYPNVRKTKRG